MALFHQTTNVYEGKNKATRWAYYSMKTEILNSYLLDLLPSRSLFLQFYLSFSCISVCVVLLTVLNILPP